MVVSGVPVDDLEPRHLAVLAALLLESNRSIHADAISNAIWGWHPPKTAHQQVLICISRIRRQLRAHGVSDCTINTECGGYMILLREDQLDLLRFERMMMEARRLASEESWVEGFDLLTGALALWRGQPLAGLGHDGLARKADELRETHLMALEDHLEWGLLVGRHREMLPEAFDLAALHQLRERFQGALLLALCMDGQRARALEHYYAYTRTLSAEVGVLPGRRLTMVHRAVLDDNLSLRTLLRPVESDS